MKDTFMKKIVRLKRINNLNKIEYRRHKNKCTNYIFFSFRIRMETNPWQVECVEVFSHFICPECPFLTKEKGFFQDHAQEHHPLSRALFGTKVHTVEDNTNIADSDIDEKDEWSDSPTPAKGIVLYCIVYLLLS